MTTRKTNYVPVTTEEQAREIVLCRIDELNLPKGPRPLRVFAQSMYQLGVSRRVLSVSYLSNLLCGRVYPNLTDRDGKPFVWSMVPRAIRGRRRLSTKRAKANLNAMQDEIFRLGSIVRVLCERVGLDDFVPATRADLCRENTEEEDREAQREEAAEADEAFAELEQHLRSCDPTPHRPVAPTPHHPVAPTTASPQEPTAPASGSTSAPEPKKPQSPSIIIDPDGSYYDPSRNMWGQLKPVVSREVPPPRRS